MIESSIFALCYLAFVAFHGAKVDRLHAALAEAPGRLGLSEAAWGTACRTMGCVLVAAALGLGWLKLGAVIAVSITLSALAVSGMMIVLAAPVARRAVWTAAAAMLVAAPLFITAALI